MPNAPDTLPADFFDKQSKSPDTLPADFFDKQQSQAQPTQQPQQQPRPQHGWLYNTAQKALDYVPQDRKPTGNRLLDAFNSVTGAVDPLTQAQGAAKGLISSAAGLGSIFNKFTGSSQPMNQQNLKDLTETHGAGQVMGKLGEQVAELASGEGAASKALSFTGSKVLPKIVAGAGIGAIQSGGDPTATTIGAVAPAIMSPTVAKGAGKFLGNTLGMTTGAGEKAIERAFSNPDSSGLAKVMRGEMDVTDVVSNLQKSVTDFRDAASAKYANELNGRVANAQIPNWSAKANGFMGNINQKLNSELGKFGVIKDPSTGEWNLRHLSGADPAEVKQLIDTVEKWGTEPRDLTPSGLDTLKRKISDFSGSGGSMSALANRLYDTARSDLEQMIPGYKEMTKDYATSQDLLRKMKSEMSVSANGGTNPGTISRKLGYLLKQNTPYREILMSRLPNGQDLLDQIAGLHLNTLAPKGLQKALVGAEGISMGLLHGNPASLGAMPFTLTATSPRAVGEVTRAAGKVAASPLIGPASNFGRRAIQVGVNDSSN